MTGKRWTRKDDKIDFLFKQLQDFEVKYIIG